MDIFSKTKRSSIMSKVHSKDTVPEMVVRRYLHSLGYRFRLYRKELPGNPDIILPKYHSIIFVHGCFWHRHAECKHASMPETNREFWEKKFNKNIERDKKNVNALKSLGWHVLIIWECEIKKTLYKQKIKDFFNKI